MPEIEVTRPYSLFIVARWVEMPYAQFKLLQKEQTMSDFHSFHQQLQSSEKSEYVEALSRLQHLSDEELHEFVTLQYGGKWNHWI